jgi:hypothetical protein
VTRPRFTHKDYVLIADTIARLDLHLPSCDRSACNGEAVGHSFRRESIANEFADALRGTNPAFDYARFIAAATGKPTTRRDVQRKGDL